MLCAFLMSCNGMFPVYEKDIIDEVKHFDKLYTYTTTRGGTFHSERLIYQVGDTLKFIK